MASKSILEEHGGKKQQESHKGEARCFSWLRRNEEGSVKNAACSWASRPQVRLQLPMSASDEKLHCLQAMARRLQPSISLCSLLQAQTRLWATHLSSSVCLGSSSLFSWKLQACILQNVLLLQHFSASTGCIVARLRKLTLGEELESRKQPLWFIRLCSFIMHKI